MFRLIITLSLLITSCVAVPETGNRPQISEYLAKPAILVFSKTAGWRHNEGIAGADRFFADLASDQGLGFHTTADERIFNSEQLAGFDVIVFNNMTGDVLSPAQEAAFQQWLEGGGAWIGLHGSGDNTHADWPWYDQQIIGPEFIGHPADPQFQTARLVSLAPSHSILDGIPGEWMHHDEWYSFDDASKLGTATALIGIDESSYTPENNVYGDVSDLRMGGEPANHPLVWVRCVGKGRSFYSAIGHSQTSYDDPVYRKLLENALRWVRERDSASTGCPMG
ncbi:ThuA domain-containing protein [Altererythrobacter sp. ZODW24]|uniref:ThuA domain-containing protein n=1 Tax=Altererythrobacter sp. ZODW24 TaxID=2185142 RepID=UPI000DF79C55|nr:ThuA domain-containing protein [Altererythrobacter sp. ZODW24]